MRMPVGLVKGFAETVWIGDSFAWGNLLWTEPSGPWLATGHDIKTVERSHSLWRSGILLQSRHLAAFSSQSLEPLTLFIKSINGVPIFQSPPSYLTLNTATGMRNATGFDGDERTLKLCCAVKAFINFFGFSCKGGRIWFLAQTWEGGICISNSSAPSLQSWDWGGLHLEYLLTFSSRLPAFPPPACRNNGGRAQRWWENFVCS